jgi:Protein of unknown function N-terminus (DUF3323)
VRLADLDESLHEATGRGLAELLAALGPPLRDLPRDRERLVAGRDATIRSVEKSSLHALGWYQAWLTEIARDGTLTKLVNVGEEERVRQAARTATAEQWRELWDSCGIVVDDLASRALVLNLPSGRRDRRLGHLPARR